MLFLASGIPHQSARRARHASVPLYEGRAHSLHGRLSRMENNTSITQMAADGPKGLLASLAVQYSPHE